MAKKMSSKQRKAQKIRQLAGVAVACMIVIMLAAAQILVQVLRPAAEPASREVTILSAPQTLQQNIIAATAVPMTPPPVMPTAVPTAVPTPEPPFEYLPVVKKGPSAEKKIAITIDDCYQVGNLETLCKGTVKYGGKLTIFPIGENLSKPGMSSLLKTVVFDHGFQVENHTYSHARVFRLPQEQMAAEIWKQGNALNQALGVNYQQSFFRLMGGDGENDQRTHNYLKQLGFQGIASWSLSGSDASMDLIKQHLSPGAIYLFHTTDADTKKLKEFIPYAVNQGYEIVTLNELLGLPANTWTDLSTAETEMPAPVSYKVEYRDQQVGDYSWSVVEIQARLMELGYLSGDSKSALNGTAADGVYGQGTAKAISSFQTDNGLVATGIADARTQQLLFGEA